MSKLTWKKILRCKGLRNGGEIYSQDREREFILRGPIEAVEVKGDTVTFRAPWCDRMAGPNDWFRWRATATRWSVNVSRTQPHDIGEGRVLFQSLDGPCILYPRDSTRLSPKEVKKLSLEVAA